MILLVGQEPKSQTDTRTKQQIANKIQNRNLGLKKIRTVVLTSSNASRHAQNIHFALPRERLKCWYPSNNIRSDPRSYL